MDKVPSPFAHEVEAILPYKVKDHCFYSAFERPEPLRWSGIAMPDAMSTK